MNRLLLATLTLAVASTLAGCSAAGGASQLHLSGEESGRTGDIRISGASGQVVWTWGPKSFTQDLDVTKNELFPSSLGGPLELKLRDGTPIKFIADKGVFICSEGCEDAHMPILWHVVSD